MNGLNSQRDAARRASAPKVVLGWREWLSLPQIGVSAMRAKIDTGARSSALHVETLETFSRTPEGPAGGSAPAQEWVRFSLNVDGSDAPLFCESQVAARRPVTDSGGHTTERVFIVTELRLAGQTYDIEINLTSRRKLLFPMLLGRTAMTGRFLVDPSASFLLGSPAGTLDQP